MEEPCRVRFRCMFHGCQSVSYRGRPTNGNIQFHSFPKKDFDLQQKWKEICGLPEDGCCDNWKICNLHFAKEDVNRFSGHVFSGAIPLRYNAKENDAKHNGEVSPAVSDAILTSPEVPKIPIIDYSSTGKSNSITHQSDIQQASSVRLINEPRHMPPLIVIKEQISKPESSIYNLPSKLRKILPKPEPNKKVQTLAVPGTIRVASREQLIDSAATDKEANIDLDTSVCDDRTSACLIRDCTGVARPLSFIKKQLRTREEQVYNILSKENLNLTISASIQTECRPLDTLTELLDVLSSPPAWTSLVKPLVPRAQSCVRALNCHSSWEHFGATLEPRFVANTVPRTLVCHDYKGGYLSDRLLDSSGADGNQYTFYHWNQIDIFVYFSHHFITIPPLCWINAAHRHGVKCLATIITESEQGKRLCAQHLFRTTASMRLLARDLARLCRLFRFDGFLLNIENPVPIECMKNLKDFVIHLTELVHDVDAGNLVIWYDSVTELGSLSWQNELNKQNHCFFEHCDGIYLNYVWTLEKIHATWLMARQRTVDVYVGVDVFGRNTFGGGQWNVVKAVSVIRDYHLSLALFAPGWTHETLTNEQYNSVNETFCAFLKRDALFWSLLSPFLYTFPITQPFATDFQLGVNAASYNMLRQPLQLTRMALMDTSLAHTGDEVPHSNEHLPPRDWCDCLQRHYDVRSHRVKYLARRVGAIAKVQHLMHCEIDWPLGWTMHAFILFESVKGPVHPPALLINVMCGSRKKRIVMHSDKFVPVGGYWDISIHEIHVLPTTDTQLLGQICRSYDVNGKHLHAFTFTLNKACTILEVGCMLHRDSESIYICAIGIKQADNSQFF